MTLPKHYDPTNLIDMVHWCRVLREIYKASGRADESERCYAMRIRILRTRERETYPDTQKATEGYRGLQRPEANEPTYR